MGYSYYSFTHLLRSSMNKFSVPMPFIKGEIDRLIELNSKIQKSKITNLYFNLPHTCPMHTAFEQNRNFASLMTDFGYWKDLMTYSLEKGFDFVYLINSPRRLDIENPNFIKELEKLQKLLDELAKIGVKKLRVSNPKLLTYLSQNHKNFELYASTSFEYKTIKEYQNFMAMHPTVKQIVPSHDLNKNFRLLANLRKQFPELDIEILVNEGCMGGCPYRQEHSKEVTLSPFFCANGDFTFSNHFCIVSCQKLTKRQDVHYMCKSNYINPWEIDEYEKIGISSFKLVGREQHHSDNFDHIKRYETYLLGVDSVENIADVPYKNLLYRFGNVHLKLTVKEIKDLLPQIDYFKEKGHLCASDCGVACKYCDTCAEKITETNFRQ